MRIIQPIHHHLFQDVVTWAGKTRTVRISKGGSSFCYPENIKAQMERLFGQLRGAGFLADLRARDFAVGQRTFLPNSAPSIVFVKAAAVPS